LHLEGGIIDIRPLPAFLVKRLELSGGRPTQFLRVHGRISLKNDFIRSGVVGPDLDFGCSTFGYI
jgi:hypothetical protein